MSRREVRGAASPVPTTVSEVQDNTDEYARSERPSFLDVVPAKSESRVRYVLLFVLAFAALSALGGLIVLPATALLSDGEVAELVRNLLPFIGTMVLLVVIARFVMGRSLWTFFAPDPSPRWGLFGRAVSIQIVAMGIGTLVFTLSPIGALEVSRPDWRVLVPAFPIALVGFAVQTLSEEIVFRGMLPQSVRRFTASPLLVFAIPAGVFAVLHVGNVSALGGGVWALVPYFATASLWGWVCYRTGSLWTSWGMHYANNVYLVLLIGSHDDVVTPLSGLAFVYSHPDAESVVATSLFSVALSGLAIWWFVIRRLDSSPAAVGE